MIFQKNKSLFLHTQQNVNLRLQIFTMFFLDALMVTNTLLVSQYLFFNLRKFTS